MPLQGSKILYSAAEGAPKYYQELFTSEAPYLVPRPDFDQPLYPQSPGRNPWDSMAYHDQNVPHVGQIKSPSK